MCRCDAVVRRSDTEENNCSEIEKRSSGEFVVVCLNLARRIMNRWMHGNREIGCGNG